jgi:hypothetical protein
MGVTLLILCLTLEIFDKLLYDILKFNNLQFIIYESFKFYYFYFIIASTLDLGLSDSMSLSLIHCYDALYIFCLSNIFLYSGLNTHLK